MGSITKSRWPPEQTGWQRTALCSKCGLNGVTICCCGGHILKQDQKTFHGSVLLYWNNVTASEMMAVTLTVDAEWTLLYQFIWSFWFFPFRFKFVDSLGYLNGPLDCYILYLVYLLCTFLIVQATSWLHIVCFWHICTVAYKITNLRGIFH